MKSLSADGTLSETDKSFIFKNAAPEAVEAYINGTEVRQEIRVFEFDNGNIIKNKREFLRTLFLFLVTPKSN